MKLIIAPRSHRDSGVVSIRLKPPPNRKPYEKQSVFLTVLPAMSMSLPMILGLYLMSRSGAEAGGSYMTMGMTTAIGSALMGTVLAVINFKKRNEQIRYAERLRKRSYRAYLKYVLTCIGEHINYTENCLRNEYPAMDELISLKQDTVTCLNGSPMGAISLRIGIGDVHYSLPITYDDDFPLLEDVLRDEMNSLISENSILKNVPVCVELNKGDVLSIISDRISDQVMILMLILARICLTYSPDKVKVGCRLTDPLYKNICETIRFMPHILNPHENNTDENTDINSDDDMVRIMLCDSEYYLTCKKRTDDIFILSGMEGGNKIIHVANDTSSLITGSNIRQEFSFDSISQQGFELIMRAACRLKNFDEDKDVTGFPICVQVAEVLGDNDNPEENWNRDTAIYNLEVPLGIGLNHRIISLNPHEKGDGPHGLIAGMTGSGKSELLINIILTMAVKYPPWYVAFFLIDYKGGGMASEMEKLPHVIGSISNLSGNDVRRAFLSLRSENERREKLFIRNGVNNILRYQEKYRDGMCTEPLPHIFIIIDEFAQLKIEEPDFMQDMIAMSRIGRSLGLHLILCTQRPMGSVDSQIISNSGFQIALRLQDPMDSKEIIRRPDAAYLNNPGRAILRVGNDERVETFQSAYAMSPMHRGRRKTAVRADACGKPAESLYLCAEGEDGETSLEYCISRICEASKKYGVILKPLWLKELPESVALDRINEIVGADYEEYEDYEDYEGKMPANSVKGIPVGIWDDPVSVKRGVLRLDVTAGNILICGMPYSGKSTLIDTLLAGIANRQRNDTENMEVYVFDWGGGLLGKYVEKPYSYGYYAEGDEQAASKKMSELLELCKPKTRNGNRFTLVVIDGIGNLTEQAGYGIGGLVKELLRKSDGAGVGVIVTSVGINPREVSKGMQGLFKQCISLRQQDVYAYSEILLNTHFKGRCDIAPGHGYICHNGRIVEFVTAIYREVKM